MKIDFGSGYNPKNNYLTADPFHPMTDIYYDHRKYKFDLEDGSVKILRCRNVIHHIKDLGRIFKEFYRILSDDGVILIIEPNKQSFAVNVLLDTIWYRFVNNKPEIWYSKKYRNYVKDLLHVGFYIFKKNSYQEKEFTLTTKKENPIMDEQVKQELEENGYEFAVAVATQAEIDAGAACGQLAIISEEN